MITLVDSTKTTGLIFFPGTMVGMLLAGASPTDAVRLQLILLYTLLGSVAIAALVATPLAYRNFFTPPAAARAATERLQPRRRAAPAFDAGEARRVGPRGRRRSRRCADRAAAVAADGRKSHSSAAGQATSRRLPSGDQATSLRRPGTVSRCAGLAGGP